MNKLIKRAFSNASRDVWYDFWRRARKNGYARDYCGRPDPLANKASLIREINQLSVDGKVRLCDRFYDCDMAVSTGYRNIPATYVHYDEAVNEIYQDAEGSGSTWLESPSAPLPDREFRDLALEAYENGHPHSVSESRYDEDGHY